MLQACAALNLGGCQQKDALTWPEKSARHWGSERDAGAREPQDRNVTRTEQKGIRPAWQTGSQGSKEQPKALPLPLKTVT